MLLLRRAPFLRPDEQNWAQEIMHEIIEIDTMLRASHSADGDVLWWLDSSPMPREFNAAAMAATNLRDRGRQLGERYSAVVRGDLE